MQDGASGPATLPGVANVIATPVKLVRSTTFRAAMAFAIAGLAHAIGVLLLARQLPAIEFAYVALFLAFLDFGVPVGTGGADTVVVRYKMGATRPLFIRVFATGLAAAVLVFWAATTFYGFSPALALVTSLAVLVGACNRVSASIWQSMERFRNALFQLQSSHVALATLAVVAIVLDWHLALIVCSLHAVYLLGLGVFGWRNTHRIRPRDLDGPTRYPWHECLPILFITAGAQLAMQTERFLIPHLLRIEDLALYGVLAAVVGSPFQMLSIAVGYTLMPRLKSATTVEQRMRLVRKETAGTLAMALAGVFVVWMLAPWVVRLFEADKYVLTQPLIFAAILVGLHKVAGAFLMSIVKALGTPRDLNRLSVAAWVGLSVSVAAAIPMSAWGLPGLLVGVAAGWTVRVVLSLWLANRALRSAQSAPAAPPGRV
jgi:O-antigen/teichoic acid export membrane protein